MNIACVYTVKGAFHRGAVRIFLTGGGDLLSPFLPSDCEVLRLIARKAIDESMSDNPQNYRLHYCCLAQFQEPDLQKILESSGIRPRLFNGKKARGWYDCTPETAILALEALGRGKRTIPSGTVQPTAPETPEPAKPPRKRKPRAPFSHPAADALDWDEAVLLIRKLYDDARYMDSMLVACGCYLGLRISDILRLRWKDIVEDRAVSLREKKTGKPRKMRINPALRSHALRCMEQMCAESSDAFIFGSWYTGMETPISRQRAARILKEAKERYGITSARVFSTHSLRKTFGRRVWQHECGQGRGEQALYLLSEVFGHSNVNITKRYLGIRQDEILSVYDSLND